MINNNETDLEKIDIYKKLEPMYKFLRKLEGDSYRPKNKQVYTLEENKKYTRQELIKAIDIIPLRFLNFFTKNVGMIFRQYKSDVEKITTKKE